MAWGVIYIIPKRIERDNEIVATVLQLGNGLWGLYDPSETRRLRYRRWSSAKDALAFVRENPTMLDDA